MDDDLLFWVRDAANSICGQTGAKTHQEKLHAAADEIERLRAFVSEVVAIDPLAGGGDAKYFVTADFVARALAHS